MLGFDDFEVVRDFLWHSGNSGCVFEDVVFCELFGECFDGVG